MDLLGHLLLGAAVAGKVTPYTVALSLLPDIGALPLQWRGGWRNPSPAQLAWYRLCHSPAMLFAAFFLPSPGFLVVATHVLSDMVTHDRPYSDFPLFQWGYDRWQYYIVLIILGGITWLRLFY